jgi:son of sevenless-like protein
MWLTQHPYDFDNGLYASIVHLLHNQLGQLVAAEAETDVQGYLSLANRIKDQLVVDNMVTPPAVMNRSFTFSKEAPASILPKWFNKNSDKPFDCLDWEPLEISRQMTLIEYGIFRRIMPKECFKLGWTKQDKYARSKHIVGLTDQFNKTSSWIATLILKEDNLKRRALLIKHWIDIAAQCKELNNYNGLNTVISALNSAALHRLKKTWAEVPQKKVKLHEDLMNIVAMSASYKNLREAIAHTEPPCVPYIGVYLTDLVFIEDGNKDMKGDVLINFHKRRQIAQVIMNIRTLQQAPYQIREVGYLAKRLKFWEVEPCADQEIWDEDALYKQSLKIEPRERKD